MGVPARVRGFVALTAFAASAALLAACSDTIEAKGADAPTSFETDVAGRANNACGATVVDYVVPPHLTADLVRLEGGRLYTLSQTMGLSITDVSDSSALKVIGRDRKLSGIPIEMYLRGDVAIVVFSHWDHGMNAISKVVALDISDAGAIEQLGAFDVPGEISHSRLAGDVLYVAAFENGACSQCAPNIPTLSVIALNVAEPRAIEKVDALRVALAHAPISERPRVVVTDQRVYVASIDIDATGPSESTIRVIDTSDPAGDLAEGAVLHARGAIASASQIDEHEGVLRVLSQPLPQSNAPHLQTFQVISSSKLDPLATLDLAVTSLPIVTSARFDGLAAYVVLSNAPGIPEERHRLFTLDLADPANPKQVGQLEMPSNVRRLELYGENVLSFGFNDYNPAGSIDVSIVDVGNLASPTLRGHVTFGGVLERGVLERPEQVLKGFRGLPEAEMIVVPIIGLPGIDDTFSCGIGDDHIGAVQLLDTANDGLRLGRVIAAHEPVQVVVARDDRLFVVGDRHAQALDITDRDKPTFAAKVALSTTILAATKLEGDLIARIVRRGWDDNGWLELASTSDADDIDHWIGALNLDRVFKTGGPCAHSWPVIDIHAERSMLYVLYEQFRSGGTGLDPAILVIDASDPTQPRVVGQKGLFESEVDAGWQYDAGRAYAGFREGSPFLWRDHALAIFEHTCVGGDTQTALRLIDLRNPESIDAASVLLGSNHNYAGLIADGDEIVTTQYDGVRYGMPAGKSKFFALRIDVSNPLEPHVLPAVNVPGVVVASALEAGRVMTCQLHRAVNSGVLQSECNAEFFSPEFRTDATSPVTDENLPGTCTVFTQSLHVVALREDGAVVEDSVALNDLEQLGMWKLGTRRLFAQGAGALFAFSGFDRGEFEIGRLDLGADASVGRWELAAADGGKALLWDGERATIVAARGARSPVIERSVALPRRPLGVELHDGAGLLLLDDRSLQWLEL